MYDISIFTGKIYTIKGEGTALLFALPGFFIKIHPTIITGAGFGFKQMGYTAGQFNIVLPSLAPVVYVVKVFTSFSVKTQRIIVQ